MTRQELFDPGLQPERTELAWRRTLLSLTVTALIALRLLPAVGGVWTVGIGGAELLVCALLWRLASSRVRQTRHALLDRAGLLLPDGRLLLGLSLAVAAVAALGLLGVAPELHQPE